MMLAFMRKMSAHIIFCIYHVKMVKLNHALVDLKRFGFELLSHVIAQSLTATASKA
jgi:hypothetical protein